MHKNEVVKNHFACNNNSRKNLRFFEFTNVNYKLVIDNYELSDDKSDNKLIDPNVRFVMFHSMNKGYLSLT